MSCKCDENCHCPAKKSTEITSKVCECPSKFPLEVGKHAPKFKGQALMPDGTFKDISLCDYKGKYLVLFFYPMDFTFVCPTEIIAFSDRYEEFKALKCELIGASCDSVYSHLAWTKVERTRGGIGKLNIPLLSDKTLDISRDYKILIEDKGISLRGLFIINGEGILRQIVVNDLPVGRQVDEVLRLIKAYQFTDEHGEVCPMNWTPGSKTINTKKSTEFFEKEYAKK